MSDAAEPRPFPRVDFDAARHVLRFGTAYDHELLEERRRSDPAFADRVAQWEERLAPLAELAPEVPPPPDAWDGIAARTVRRDREIARWRRSARAWQGAFAMAASVMVAAIGTAAWLALAPPPEAPLVAALGAPDASTLALVRYDPETRVLAFEPAVAGEADERVPELWLVVGEDAPLSLGLLSPSGRSELVIPPALADRTAEDATLVITLEPPGGAPGGVATGPAVAVGKLRRL